MTRTIVVVLLSMVLSGCSIYHVRSQDTTSDYYPSKQSAEDVVYLEKVDRPHQTIGVITVNAERRQSLSDVLDKMKREAAVIGGDAITNIQTDASGNWKKLPAQDIIGNAYVRANFSADVVIFQ